MSLKTKTVYEFGPFRLDPAERSLRREDKPVSLTPKMFDILLFLMERNGQVVEKEDLMRAIWPDTFVEESNLTVNISSLRKALSEAPNGHHYIETVQRRGYRFDAALKRRGEAGEHGGEIALDLRLSNANAEKPAQPAVALPPADGTRRSSQFQLLAFAIIVVAGAFAFGIYQFNQTRRAQSLAPFQTMKLTRLTNSGKAQEAVISPDGKYVLYILADAGKRSLWVRQVASESNLPIIPPTEMKFGGMTVSRDGNFVYFLKVETDKQAPALYQMPILGGEARKLMTDISTPVTISPNGKQIAFLRQRPANGESSLVIAEADGSGTKTLATRHRPESLTRTPAWSPDGKVIACQSQTKSGFNYGVVAISVADGTEKIITAQQWEAGQIAWLPDGSGLVMSAVEHNPGAVSANWQLWQVSFPDGQMRRITNDLNHYGGVSLTADANALVTVQRDRQSNIWVVPQGQTELARQITFGSGKYDGLGALAWTPDGRIIYATDVNGKRRLWLMEPDGSNPKPLTPDKKEWINTDVAVSYDGRFIVYVSAFDLPHLWRMNLSGGEPQQLTFGDGEDSPQISPDGEWIVYTAPIAEKPVLMKIPAKGGSPAQITDQYATRPAVSPNGKLIAYQHWDEQLDSPPRTVIIPFTGGAPIKSFTFDPQTSTRWSVTGKGLIHIETRAGISNLWLQPLDGSASTQLTDFKTDRIYNYAWSRDGKQLACVRGAEVSDVVLINSFR